MAARSKWNARGRLVARLWPVATAVTIINLLHRVDLALVRGAIARLPFGICCAIGLAAGYTLTSQSRCKTSHVLCIEFGKAKAFGRLSDIHFPLPRDALEHVGFGR